MKRIDFEHLDENLTKEMNNIAKLYRREYVEFVDRSMKDEENITWLTAFASRNSMYTYRTAFKLLTIKKLLEDSNEVNEIVVNNIYEKKAMKKLYKGRKIKITCPRISWREIFIFQLLNFGVHWSMKIKEYFQIKKQVKINKKKKLSFNQSITMIDTYVLASSFQNGKYHDRYFGNILKYSDVPLVFSTISINNKKQSTSQLYSEILNEKDYMFVLKETYLRFIDYLWMLKWPMVVYKQLKKKYVFAGIDLTDIVKYDLLYHLAYENSLDGLIACRFLYRMKKLGIKIKKNILWYEGQPSSLGFVLGMRKYYPNVKSLGYVGIPLMENELYLFPSKEQQLQKVCPDEIGVIGEKYVEDIKKYCDNLQVCICPAFRYAHLRQMEENIYPDNKKILIVMPGDVKVALDLLEAIINSKESKKYSLYIKNHPINSNFLVSDYRITESIEVKYLQGDLVTAIRNENIGVVIAAKTASGMEILLQGVNLIMYTPSGELINNGIKEDISGYQIAFGKEDIDKCLLKIESGINDIKQLDAKSYFEDVNKSTVADMLN